MKTQEKHKQLEAMQIQLNRASANPKMSLRKLFGEVSQKLRLSEEFMGSPTELRNQFACMA